MGGGELEPQRRCDGDRALAQLFHGLKAHISELEIERDLASDRDLGDLDRRTADRVGRLLFERLSKALEPEPAVSMAQTPPIRTSG